MNTHNVIIEFGKHKGERWTRLPINYLKWICTEGSFGDEIKSLARSELQRRGTVTPKIDISGHAIDRASLHLRRHWHEDANSGEGLHAWLCRIGTAALEKGEHLESGQIIYQSIKFVFINDGDWPVMKTIMPSNRKEKS